MDKYMGYDDANTGIIFEMNNENFFIIHVVYLGIYKVLVTLDCNNYVSIFTFGIKSKMPKLLHSYDISGLITKLKTYK